MRYQDYYVVEVIKKGNGTNAKGSKAIIKSLFTDNGKVYFDIISSGTTEMRKSGYPADTNVRGYLDMILYFLNNPGEDSYIIDAWKFTRIKEEDVDKELFAMMI
jgi:hypothetical protein